MLDAKQGFICFRHSGNECLRNQNVPDQYQDQVLNRFRAQDVCSPPANDPCTLTTGSTSRQRADIFGLVPAHCGTMSSKQRAEYDHLEWNSISSPSSFLFLLHPLFLGMKDTISFSGSLFMYSASLLLWQDQKSLELLKFAFECEASFNVLAFFICWLAVRSRGCVTTALQLVQTI